MAGSLTATKQSNQALTYNKRVFFSGNGTVNAGIGLCYDRIVATQLSPDVPATVATAAAEIRDNVVALPATANRGNFAGVSATTYPGVTGGQWITIHEPGSVTMCAVDDACTINATSFNFSVNGDPGVFIASGLEGRGQMIALQTTLTASTTSGSGPLAKSIDGTGTYTQATKTVSKTSAFANAVAGDIVVVVGGAVAADGTKPLTLGRFTIASVTSANAAVLSTDPALTNGAATATICFYVVRGNPTVLAFLVDGGKESGGTDFYQPVSAGTATLDINGYTLIMGGGITLAADDTPGLAVNTIVGRQRGFESTGTITTSEVIVTLTTTTGIKADQVTTMASIELGEAAEVQATIEWGGKKWQIIKNVGAVIG